jgi:threonine synthase
MLYHSTRGAAPILNFRDVTMAGLASDGGLYVPQTWPQFSADDIAAMRGLSYQDIAVRVMRPFVAGCLDDATSQGLIAKAYASFDHPEITPLRQLDEDHYLLELFHGPTLAFKDVALQFLGQLFEHFLAESGQRITVLGATSGDTGSAAMAALANRRNIECVILYPEHGPSAIQRRQMTCLAAPNVHAVAVRGSFDECQALVKALFNDPAARRQYNLAAVNSINWARILAQIVYYFVAAVRLGAPDKAVSFVVPTGNFGNIYAAYAAQHCGLPISKLAVASNRNDILTHFFQSGTMAVQPVQASLSPSMDIQVSSNAERLLFDLCQRDAAALTGLMADLQRSGTLMISPYQLGAARQLFTAASLSDEATLATIKQVFTNFNCIIDPHTAVGVGAAEKLTKQLPGPVVMLACAHPAKFPETIQRAINLTSDMPKTLSELLQKPERNAIIDPEIQSVSTFLSANTRAG